jgi:NADPH:quinone reductase-like Zn-dependent oxidoreductase
MRAIVYERYGAPDLVHLRETERPTPGDTEVLVRVRAASASPFDWHLMRGAPFLARLNHGLRRPKDPRLGADLSGEVVSVGAKSSRFHPGDEVFGERTGSFADYVSVPEDSLALKPTNVSFEAAATVPISGVTALQALRDLGHVRPGQQVLINGAAGGVGTFAVQIAKSFGAEVTAVCSTRNVDLVRSIGADHVIDYLREDFTRNGLRYDLVIDAVGNRSVSDLRRTLRPQGICVVVGFTTMFRLLAVVLQGKMVSRKGGVKIILKTMPINQEGLLFMAGLLESRKVVPVIDRRFTLENVPQALEYLEEGHAQGKVVITIDPTTRAPPDLPMELENRATTARVVVEAIPL